MIHRGFEMKLAGALLGFIGPMCGGTVTATCSQYARSDLGRTNLLSSQTVSFSMSNSLGDSYAAGNLCGTFDPSQSLTLEGRTTAVISTNLLVADFFSSVFVSPINQPLLYFWDVDLTSDATATQGFLVTGGTGAGTLRYNGTGDVFCSTFCSSPSSHSFSLSANGYPLPLIQAGGDFDLPFVFDEPFTITVTVHGELHISGLDPQGGSFYDAGAALQALRILDANGNPVSGAVLTAVPEPGSWLSVVPLMVIAGWRFKRHDPTVVP